MTIGAVQRSGIRRVSVVFIRLRVHHAVIGIVAAPARHGEGDEVSNGAVSRLRSDDHKLWLSCPIGRPTLTARG